MYIFKIIMTGLGVDTYTCTHKFFIIEQYGLEGASGGHLLWLLLKAGLLKWALMALFSWVVNLSKDGRFPSLSVPLFPCLTILTVQKVLMLNWNFLC